MTDQKSDQLTTEPIEGSAQDVTEGDDVKAELERVEQAGLMPVPRPESRAITYREATELGHVLAASGYFSDATSAAQAAVKVMVGSELGFAPMASIMGVHIVEGRPMLAGNLLAAMLKRDAHFDYEIVELPESHEELKPAPNGMPTSGKCVVAITFDGARLDPLSSFSIEEAKNAGLLKERGNWHKYPRKMLFWRALSWGVDFHAPHLAGGVPLLTTGEIETSEDDGDSTGIAAALNPPKQAAPPLTDEKAEKLRAEARGVYDELKDLNPTLIVPGKFGNLVRGAEHSHEALTNLVVSLKDLVKVEREIDEVLADLREHGEAVVDAALEAAARKPDRRGYLESLQASLASAGTDEKGGE